MRIPGGRRLHALGAGQLLQRRGCRTLRTAAVSCPCCCARCLTDCRRSQRHCHLRMHRRFRSCSLSCVRSQLSESASARSWMQSAHVASPPIAHCTKRLWHHMLVHVSGRTSGTRVTVVMSYVVREPSAALVVMGCGGSQAKPEVAPEPGPGRLPAQPVASGQCCWRWRRAGATSWRV
jgi:hypothetical protein